MKLKPKNLERVCQDNAREEKELYLSINIKVKVVFALTVGIPLPYSRIPSRSIMIDNVRVKCQTFYGGKFKNIIILNLSLQIGMNLNANPPPKAFHISSMNSSSKTATEMTTTSVTVARTINFWYKVWKHAILY